MKGYIATVYMGSNRQSLNLWVDTRADYLVLQDFNCPNCGSGDFYPSQGSSTLLKNTNKRVSRNYSDTIIKGYLGYDQVSLDIAGEIVALNHTLFMTTE